MPLNNLLKKQVDLPVFEWMKFSPLTASATNCFSGLEGQTGERYLYTIDLNNVNYRYDTWSDSWEQIAPLPTALFSHSKARSTKSIGHRGHVISGTSSTLKIGGLGIKSKAMVGLKIRIVSGLGAGQERTISSVDDPVIEDFGILTSGASTTLTDSTKKWRFNQWDGYNVRIISQGSSQTTPNSQSRRVLYNSQTALIVSDTNHQMIDPFNNTPFNTSNPFSTPTANTHYLIESVTLNVNSPWSVTPDGSSIFMLMSGGVWFTDGTNTNTLYFYDEISDTWIQKTGIGLNSDTFNSSTSDFPFTVIDEAGGAFVSGLTATSATSKTLVNTGASMSPDRYANHQLRIISGTGVGQQRRIVGHGVTFMHIERNWDITPDNTSQYQIWGDTDKLYFMPAGGFVNMMQYSIDGDLWGTGQIFDYGISRQISATPYSGASYGAPHQGYGVTSIVRTTSGILSGAINAAGTNYVVGDLVTCSTTGTNGTFFVTSVGAGGAVTGLQLAASGSGYSNGSSNTTGGSGSGLTITLTVGTTALVTTATSHDFRDFGPDQVKIAGCATDTSFNAVFNIIGVGSQTSFSIAAPSSSASPTAANGNTSNLLVDAEKNWSTNEHVGKVIRIYGTGGVNPGSIQCFRIASNTATTITTTSSITTPTNGTTRYVICDVHGFGAAQTSKVKNREAYGFATSGSATTLVDSTKDWRVNQWLNCRVRVIAGTGVGNESAITANTATTLTVASWGVATPDSTSKYQIMDSFGIATSGAANTINDTAKNWTTNILVGKKVTIVAGTGRASVGTISSNTSTSITASGMTTPDNTSVYVVAEQAPRRSQSFVWLFGLSDSAKRGRYLLLPFSETTSSTLSFDYYDIPTNTWDIGEFVTPSAINGNSNQANMFAYDGNDTYYMNLTGNNRIYALNILTGQLDSAGTMPYAHSTAIGRQGMAVVTTDDGLKYIYIQRHSGQEMWRTLKFW